ncbi:MAG: hypothetical protein E6I97_16425 [Chloroflexi bacterium]|nr:MAG: hypothetical protein E6I97_16425 [Chloroflexota bacterium]
MRLSCACVWADVRQPHEGHDHLGPLKPRLDRLPSFRGIQADPGGGKGWREQVGSLEGGMHTMSTNTITTKDGTTA